MKFSRSHMLAFTAMTLLGWATSITDAQDDIDPNAHVGENGGGIQDARPTLDEYELLAFASRAALPPESQDPTFDRYVNIGLVGVAVSNRDASLLADTALQLQEAERVLLRQHKSGVTAASLLGKAIRLAAETGDKATLVRLTHAAAKTQDAELAAQIQATQKLAGASRVAEPDLAVNVHEIDAATFALITELYEAIRTAALIGDPDQLRAIEAEIKEVPLPDVYTAKLSDLVTQAIASVPDSSPADVAISKLTAASRAICRKCSGLGRYVRGFGTVRCDRCGGSGRTYDDDGGGTAGWDTETSSRGSGNSSGNIAVDNNVKKRFTYTLWNSCENANILVRLPGNKSDQLPPGAKKTYTFSGSAKDAVLYVYNTKKQYSLRAGNHKFWWMREGKPGLDLNAY